MLIFGVTRWRSLESEHFRIVYPEAYEDMARHAASWIETERETINNLTGWDPGKVWLVIEDVGMGVNGFANPVGADIHLFSTPPGGFDLSTRDWMRTVGIHEYTHISSIQPVYGFPKLLNILFGPWMLPNALVPGWMIEGVTVYCESQVEPYEGRLESGFFDANLLTRTSHGMFPKRWEMDGSLTRFPGGAIYAYGGPFFEWMVEEKGAETVKEFYRINGASIPGFFIDRSARRSFGDGFPYLLHDWKQAAHEQALTWVSADSAARRLTDKGWYVSGVTTDGERVYYARTSVAKRAALNTSWYVDVVALDPSTDEEEVVLRPNTPVRSLRVHDGVLYYSTVTLKRGFANTANASFGELVDLGSYNLTTGEKQKLYEGRLRAFDRVPDGSFLLSVDRTPEFGSVLLRILPEGSSTHELYEGELLIGEIIVSDEGKVYFAAREQGEHWDIYTFAEQSWNAVTNTRWAESGLSFDSQGNLLYAANPEGPQGKVTLYTMDTETGIHKRFNNTPGYAVAPVLVRNDLVFQSLNPEGYDLYVSDTSSSHVAFYFDPGVTNRTPAYQGGFERRSRFRPYLSLLRPWARIPYVFPQFDSTWNLTNLDAGIFLMGADVVGENSYQANVSYDAVTNTNAVDFGWSNQRFAPLSLNVDYSHSPIFGIEDTLVGYDYSIYPSFSYPLYYRPGRGLNVIRWGEGVLVRGSRFERRSITSSFAASFSWPFFNMGFAANHSWESFLFSDVVGPPRLYLRGAGISDLAGGIILGDIRTFIHGRGHIYSIAYNFIRGYDSLYVESNLFSTVTLEYRHRLLKMRFGIWNPNIFFEDLYVNVFTDAAFDSQNLLGASAGLELSPEIHLFWGYVRIAPILGVSVNMEGEINPHYGISTSLPFEIFHKRQDAVEFASDPWLDVGKHNSVTVRE